MNDDGNDDSNDNGNDDSNVMNDDGNDDSNANCEYKIILVVFFKNLRGEFIRPSQLSRLPIPSLLIRSQLPLGMGQKRLELQASCRLCVDVR